MKTSGPTTQIPTDMRQKLDTYILERTNGVNELRSMLEAYDNSVNEFEENRFEFFDYNRTQKIVRMWDIIMDLKPQERNLILMFEAVDHDYDKMAEYFGQYKSCATLRVLLSNVRKEIRHKYQTKYKTC